MRNRAAPSRTLPDSRRPSLRLLLDSSREPRGTRRLMVDPAGLRRAGLADDSRLVLLVAPPRNALARRVGVAGSVRMDGGRRPGSRGRRGWRCRDGAGTPARFAHPVDVCTDHVGIPGRVPAWRPARANGRVSRMIIAPRTAEHSADPCSSTETLHHIHDESPPMTGATRSEGLVQFAVTH